MNLERVRRMLIKEFIHVFRDPKMRGIVFVVPVLQTLVFGYAVSTDVRHVATAVQDLDNSVASREVVARFEASDAFDIVARTRDDRRVRRLLDRGEARVVLRMNPGFDAALRAGRRADLQVLVDGTDSTTAGIVLDYSARLLAEAATALAAGRQGRGGSAAAPPPGVELRARAWFNENLESRNFYVPGVIAILVMLVTLLLTSMAVVREKEIGTMEQILVTPISPAEFILGKTVPFALIGLLCVGIVTAVGVTWFDVPIRGSPWLLLGATGLFLMTTLGIGLLISTVSATQQQAMLTTLFLYIPCVLLSGFVFPIANMPEPVQWLTRLNPLRYFIVILRGLFLKGVGFQVLWPHLLALAIIGPLTLWAAGRRFHKTLA